MSIIKKLIVHADAESRYLTPGEMDQIKSFMKSGDRRLRLVKTLTERRERIVKEATSTAWHKFTYYIEVQGLRLQSDAPTVSSTHHIE
ncbi:MAG TPA: hypothetical protein V6D19_20740 [Stenomitos sp.]